MTSPIMYSRRRGRLTASSAPASSASGCRPRRGSWSHDWVHAFLRVRVALSHPRRFSDPTRRPAMDRQDVMPGSRRFPPPWTPDEGTESFINRDANEQALAYVFTRMSKHAKTVDSADTSSRASILGQRLGLQ